MNNTTTLMKDAIVSMCSCFYDNYQLYEQSTSHAHTVCVEIYERYTNRIHTILQDFLSNFIQPASIEYIWMKENQDGKAVYDYLSKMLISYGLNQKLHTLIQQLNIEIYDQAQMLTQKMFFVKLPGREKANPDVPQAFIQVPNLKISPIKNIPFTINQPTDTLTKLVDGIFSNTVISKKWNEYRKPKVIQAMIEMYNKELNDCKEEIKRNMKEGLDQLEISLTEYRDQVFLQTNHLTWERIPEEILKLELEMTKLSIGDDSVKLFPYINKENQLDYWAGRYARRIKGLLNQDQEAILNAWKRQYLNPYKENLTKQVQALMEEPNSFERVKTLLNQVTFIAEVKEIQEMLPFVSQIEFGTMEHSLVLEINELKHELNHRMYERFHLRLEAEEKKHEEQILIGIKSLNDIAYRKFFHIWSASVKDKMKKLVTGKNFLGLPLDNDYEYFFHQRKAYLAMSANEIESIEEVFEYRVKREPMLNRYQYLTMVETKDEDLLKSMISEEIQQYLAKLESVRNENQKIWDAALRMYLKEYAENVRKTMIEPVWQRLCGSLRREWEAYVEQEYLRHNFKPMDFAKYIGAYGKIDSQVLDLILSNEKAFPLKQLSTFHWSDKRGVTTSDFYEFHRKLKEQWLELKQEIENK